MTPLLWALCFLAAFCFAQFVLLAAVDARRTRLRGLGRLQRLGAATRPGESPDEDSILRGSRGGSGPRRWLEPLHLLLERAGRPLGAGSLLALMALAGGAGAGVATALLGGAERGLPFATAGLLPLLWVYWRRRVRMRRFEELFPEALELLARGLRAGHALSSGLQLVGEELPDPVGPEFARVSEEIRLGLDLKDALADMSRRVAVPDMPFFVTALVIQRETGGNLAEIIDGLARVIRDRHMMYGKIQAVTAQTRWSANILLLAPFVFAGSMSLLRPSYVAPLWETPAGRAVVTAALVMVLVGYVICRRVGVVRV